MLTDRPEAEEPDALSSVLRAVRLAGALQFCIAPSGDWRTGRSGSLPHLLRRPEAAIPFHVIVEGRCWVEIDGARMPLAAGDAVAFPFATPHDLGAGEGGVEINPVADLPPRPWRLAPVLRYGGSAGPRTRILCGVVECDAASFPPLRAALPRLLHAKAAEAGGWLAATVAQIAAEVDRPRAGGVSMLERLSEVLFIELLRHQIAAAPAARGWLAALGDPSLARCLAAIHADPRRDWTLEALAAAACLSRSAFCARFTGVLGIPPMRYLREWRLTLARAALGEDGRSIASVAYEAGYGAEAAFSRAFSRAFGAPPAAWRAAARASATAPQA